LAGSRKRVRQVGREYALRVDADLRRGRRIRRALDREVDDLHAVRAGYGRLPDDALGAIPDQLVAVVVRAEGGIGVGPEAGGGRVEGRAGLQEVKVEVGWDLVPHQLHYQVLGRGGADVEARGRERRQAGRVDGGEQDRIDARHVELQRRLRGGRRRERSRASVGARDERPEVEQREVAVGIGRGAPVEQDGVAGQRVE